MRAPSVSAEVLARSKASTLSVAKLRTRHVGAVVEIILSTDEVRELVVRELARSRRPARGAALYHTPLSGQERCVCRLLRQSKEID